MIEMSWQDASFLQLESANTPMHVTYLLIFDFPSGASDDFVKQLEQHYFTYPVTSAPFNYRLKQAGLLATRPKWAVLDNVDPARHFGRVELAAPGGERELGEFVSAFHSQALALDEPAWQMRLIDGLDQNRFALCLKLHHSMADGLRLLRIARRCLSADPNKPSAPPWATALNKVKSSDAHKLEEWSNFFFGMLTKDDNSLRKEKHTFPRPPRSVLNGTITANRRVATQSISLERVKQVAKASNGSINDVVIALCSKALRKHLLDNHELPTQSLVAGIPVALRNNEDREYGNALGGMTVTISTDVATDWVRMVKIRDATQQGKKFIHMMPNALNQSLSAFSLYFTKAKLLLKQDLNKATPLSNLTISNLPGPREQLYLNGAPLQSLYPASVLMPDQRLTIMLVSYLDQLHFCLVGCPDHLLHMQKIAESLSTSLDELEQAFQ